MAELMREHTYATVLRLNRVVADPVTGTTHRGASQRIEGWARTGRRIVIGIPAMTPDGVLALCTTTRLFAVAGMDDLEVIDITIGFVEVAIPVIVIAIPDIELAQVGIDFSGSLASGDLAVIPG